MKRIITLVAVAAASLFMAARAHAQFGIVGGITSSKTELTTAEDVKSMSLYHAGVTYKVDLGAGFAIQPSVLYQVKGASLGELNSSSSEDFKVKTGYVEVPVGLQWGPDLMVFRPFVMAEPFIGYQVTSSDRGADSVEGWTEQAANIMRCTAYLKQQLDSIGWPAWVNRYSNTVFFRRPSDDIIAKYTLALGHDDKFGGNLAHVVVMQHVTKEKINGFISDLMDELEASESESD